MGEGAEPIANDTTDTSWVETAAPDTKPEGIAAAGSDECRPANFDVLLGRTPGLITDRHRPLLITLPADANKGRSVDVGRHHCGEFRDTETRSVEDFEESAITQIHRPGAVEIVKESLQRRCRDRLGKRARALGLWDAGRRIRRDGRLYS